MKSKTTLFLIASVIMVLPTGLFPAQKFGLQKLISSYSQKRLVETAADHNGSLSFHKARSDTDVIHLIAFLVQFDSSRADNNPLTTGDGLFGVGHDQQELTYYNSDTVYRFDHLPHDNSDYFQFQLEYVKRYFAAVSRGHLRIDYTILPQGNGTTYTVPNQMSFYSPGYKQPSETYDNYYARKTVGLLKFVKDAINGANKSGGPFDGLRQDSTTGNILDTSGHKVVFMIIHAGASFLTDGGNQGSLGRNTPSDMIDVFVTPQYFDFYKDTLGLSTAGVGVNTGTDSLFINEIMMCSETSNQDGLNFGIHGIMVNQVARQLGIPDLFSTSSGMTAVGGFCIMDPYGYSAANGFIPPWPSAWVRAFMGWDEPKAVRIGEANVATIKAVSAAGPQDTTILQVPINDHEYYLIENRQRNLSGDNSVFVWDTLHGSQDTVIIDPSSWVNLKSSSVVDSVKGLANVIVSVKNYDVGIPASGILVWHVDENIIRDRLNYDLLNADSNYKAVKLEEADGINDLGVEGRDIFYQPVFDFGGAEDVFPHFTKTTKDSFKVNSMGPFPPKVSSSDSFPPAPTTHANDGGQTYLSMTFDTLPRLNAVDLQKHRTERAIANGHLVMDYADSVFKVSVKWNFLVPGWPKHTVPDSLFEPAVFGSGSAKKLAILSASGRFYAFAADSARSIGDKTGYYSYVNSRGSAYSSAYAAGDTVATDQFSYDSLAKSYVFPTVINDALLVPSHSGSLGGLYRIVSVTAGTIAIDTTHPFAHFPVTYLCTVAPGKWAMGCDSGKIDIGNAGSYAGITGSIALATQAPVCALCALPLRTDNFACVQTDGSLSICRISTNTTVAFTSIKNGVPPYTLASGDINKDSVPEIVVADSRKGLWVYTMTLALAPGWTNPSDSSAARSKLPVNTAPVSLADINGDGFLDIVYGDVQGVYAVNYKGALISGWPSQLDNRFPRGIVSCSPVVVKNAGSPMVIFHSPTGENETFEVDSITYSDKSKGIIVFTLHDGTHDTITNLTASYIDSAVGIGGKLVTPVVLPGGFVDAIDKNGKRPLKTLGNNQLYSNWPLTAGGSFGTSPFVDDFDNDGRLNLFAVSQSGFVYRWKLDPSVIGDTVLWKQVGYDGSRCFAYLGSLLPTPANGGPPITFFSYPNPTTPNPSTGYDGKTVYFKYKFSGPAQNVRLDVFTMAGHHVLSKTGISGSFPDWNELPPVSLATYGPGVYRCRLEAEISGKKYAQYWKMAVVK
jgi:hypothetical protein